MAKPSPGRVVHYVSFGTPVRADGSQAYTSQCRAATVTEAGVWLTTGTVGRGTDEAGKQVREVTQVYDPEACALVVHNPTGLFFNGAIAHDEDGKAGGTWHWPEREE